MRGESRSDLFLVFARIKPTGQKISREELGRPLVPMA
jgi:hypothetical protein